MEDKNTPAFPFVAKDHTGTMINMGMSLRDYFAAKAMQGMYANDADNYDFDGVAKAAYRTADAMINARMIR